MVQGRICERGTPTMPEDKIQFRSERKGGVHMCFSSYLHCKQSIVAHSTEMLSISCWGRGQIFTYLQNHREISQIVSLGDWAGTRTFKAGLKWAIAACIVFGCRSGRWPKQKKVVDIFQADPNRSSGYNNGTQVSCLNPSPLRDVSTIRCYRSAFHLEAVRPQRQESASS